MTIDPTSRAFFENMYRNDPDPWEFASSPYEQRRYEAILHALDGKHYRHAFEPGCSVGVLTHQLAALCNRVDAIDISPTAVKLAQIRCQECPNVYITCDSLAHPIAGDIFDLVVFSEIGYYFEERTLRDILQELVARIEPKGMILASHWLGSSPDHLLHGDRVHDIIGEVAQLSYLRGARYADFRLDCWSRE
jgi:SAM-dependent methyltransferase